MILSDSELLYQMERGYIVLTPFDRARLGSNSYDVTLAPTLGTYGARLDPEQPEYFAKGGWLASRTLDCATESRLTTFEIPPEGFVLVPGELYLGCTVEYTESHRHVPVLNGKSSLGRLGLFVHVTAGFGDVGFCGFWTLELVVVRPVRVYAGMPVGQIVWHAVEGSVMVPYNRKGSAKYVNDKPTPVASAMWRNFVPAIKIVEE